MDALLSGPVKMQWHTFTSLIVLFCHFLTTAASVLENCPSPCSCSVKASTLNTLVNCTAKNLSEIPVSFPEKTEHLLLDHNAIEVVDLTILPLMPSLKTLEIRHCGLRSVIGGPKLGDSFPLLETVDFSHNKLRDIPDDLPRSTRTLYLGSNNIQNFTGNVFRPLRKLRELYLDHNLVQSISMSSFHNDNEEEVTLANLENLSLKKNKLTSISPKAFENLISLTALNLAKNKLTTLKSKVFYRLLDLEHLDLSSNRLAHIEDETMFMLKSLRFLSLKRNALVSLPRGLPMLEWLDLSHNKIRNISSQFQTDLYPAELFIIAHNPLHCDCHMVWLKELFDRREYLLKHIELAQADFVPVCASPKRVAGESWDLLSDDMFVCKSEDAEEEDWVGDDRSQDALAVSLGQVTEHSVQIRWSLRGKPDFTAIFIQYYIFGKRSSTTRHIEVNAAQREFTLRQLTAESNYIACVIPKMSLDVDTDKLKPMSYDHCMEVVTTAPKPIQNLSYVAVAGYYFLGMMATIIGIFSFIGGIALAYGMWNAKCSDWSAKYAAEAAMPDLDLHTKLTQEEAAAATATAAASSKLKKEETKDPDSNLASTTSENCSNEDGQTSVENKKDK